MKKNHISAFVNDSEFLVELVSKCDRLNIGISFPGSYVDANIEDIIIIDLNDNSISPFQLGEKFSNSNKIVFGIVNRLNKKIQIKANQSGFDLIFPKNIFCSNLKAIINQINISL